MNFDNYKFHPSSLGKIMTGSRDKDDPLGETCKTHLIECFISEVYKRKKDIITKYMEKGILQEEESITLYSLVTGKFHKKNKETIENDFLIGTPDLFDGENIRNATHVIDIKTSWDIFTFFEAAAKPINKMYEWQLQGYMSLTKAITAKLVYCLVDTPDHLINDAKRKIQYAMNVIDPDTSPELLKQFAQIEHNMKFGDMPNKDKCVSFSLSRDQDLIGKAEIKMALCREYLNDLLKSKGPQCHRDLEDMPAEQRRELRWLTD